MLVLTVWIAEMFTLAPLSTKINDESAGICSGIWVQRILNPVSGKKSIFCTANRLVFMLRSGSMRLDERQQASKRGFEA
ncbi:hypothetical protein TNCV_3316331 [Trichonephila clavipes]|nr:hypothetical protein TNCV_3316331 [Trichonephila clavipes]